MRKYFLILLITLVKLLNYADCVPQWGQCGGLGYKGSTVCDSGFSCFRQNAWYSQCLTSCPTSCCWDCQNKTTVSTASTSAPTQASSVTAKLYDQCGGIGFTGPKTCQTNTYCFKQNDWYFQCLYTCPSGWACQSISTSTTTTPIAKQCIGTTKSKAPNTSKDWRLLDAVTPIKNQGSCNACWAFAATSAIESQYLIRYKANISLSEQYLVDCSGFGDCSAGFPDIAFNYVIKYGIPLTAYYPYTAKKGTCKLDSSKSAAVLTEFDVILNDEIKMQIAIDAIGPIVVLLNRDILNSYTSGIINDPLCSSQTDHAALAVGYGTENGIDYWIVKNSWGTSWGENGYFKIARGKNMCGIGIKAMIPIVYTLPEFCQCDGFDFVGANLCGANSACYKQNDYYFQCLSSCPSGWPCNNTVTITNTTIPSLKTVPLYGQCGGLNYNGPTICALSSCYSQQIWYSQCLTSCPDGWQCQSKVVQLELKVWKSTDQLYFQKLNTTTWVQLNYTRIVSYLTLSSLTNDTIILADTKTNIYYRLNSVDLRTGTSLSNLNTFVTSGSWLLFYTQSTGSYGIWKQKNVNNYYISLSPMNTVTWIQYFNGNNYLVDLIQNSTTTGEIVLYDSTNDKYLKLNSSRIYSGKSLNSTNTYEFDGTWTSFAPGFTLYGPSITTNTTKLTTTTKAPTTLLKKG